MTRHIHKTADYSDRVLGWPDWAPRCDGDLVLKIAYTISEWAIAVVGPLFWICLAAGLLTAGFGG